MNIYYTNPQFIKLPVELQNHICSYLPPHPITKESLYDYYIPSMYKLERFIIKNKKTLVDKFIEIHKETLLENEELEISVEYYNEYERGDCIRYLWDEFYSDDNRIYHKIDDAYRKFTYNNFSIEYTEKPGFSWKVKCHFDIIEEKFERLHYSSFYKTCSMYM
jgi:hypothetical protein